jgi:nicotinamide phosphoribosyltransferase
MNYDMLFGPFLVDGYKTDHRRQYPDNASLVFSNFTPRGSRVEGCTKVILDGLQYLMDEYLINVWNKTFFEKSLDEVVARFEEGMLNYIGPNRIGVQHIIDLHNFGKLPLEIWALPEGSAVDLRVSMFVLWNSRPDILDPTMFAWITNNVETIVSNTTWLACTSATTALMYRELLEKHCRKTNPEMIEFVKWQGHDFSMRGHGSLESSCLSGGAHLLSFYGTDTMPAIDYLKFYYGADASKEIIGGSVSATEHSTQCVAAFDIMSTLPDEIDESHEFYDFVSSLGG